MKPTYLVDVIAPSMDILVRVTADPMFRHLQLNGPAQVCLSPHQYPGFVKWLRGEGNIQDLIPDLDDDGRETLLSGLDEDSWKAAVGGGSDDEDKEVK